MSALGKNIVEAIMQTEERFLSVAPKTINFESEKGFAVQLLSNNPYLARVAQEHPRSLQQAVFNVASIGLSLNPAKKEAYLITRTVKTQEGKYETRVFLEPSYMGLYNLATSTGIIEWVAADVVHEKDKFVDNGPGEKMTHIYEAFKDRGPVVGAYCTAKLKCGDYLTTVMPLSEIESIRDRSEAWKAFKAGKAKSGGPWETDFNEQAKKTVVRRAFKMWPKTKETDRLSDAVHISDVNEGFEPILTSPDLGQFTAETKAFFDQLIEKSNALGMYAFRMSLDNEAVFTSLYHSFEKGQKGKYQRIIDDLYRKGIETAQSVADTIEQAAINDDSLSAEESFSELTDEERAVILPMLSDNARHYLKETLEL